MLHKQLTHICNIFFPFQQEIKILKVMVFVDPFQEIDDQVKHYIGYCIKNMYLNQVIVCMVL